MRHDFLTRAAQQWERVVQEPQTQVEKRHIEVVGVRVTLSFAGKIALNSLWPAISHLDISSLEAQYGAPQLEIFVWDAAETGVSLPVPDANLQIGSQGRLLNLPEPLRAAFNLDSGVLQLYAPHENRAFVAIRDARTLPPYERAAPLRLLWGFVGEIHGFVATHSAAVAWNGRAILLAGRGGSGKSTTSLACLLAGFEFLGDDYVAVQNAKNGQNPRVHSLYRSAKVGARSLELHPHLKSAIAIEPRPHLDDKWVLFADQLGAGCGELVKQRPLHAVVLPRVRGHETVISGANAARALAALAPSSVFQLAGASSCIVESLTALARAVPVWDLALAPDDRAAILLKQWLQNAF